MNDANINFLQLFLYIWIDKNSGFQMHHHFAGIHDQPSQCQAALRGDLCLLRKHIRRSAPPVNAPLHAARGDEYLTLLHVWPSADCGHTRRFTAGCFKLILCKLRSLQA